MVHTGLHAGFGDFVEGHAVGFVQIHLEHVGEVPRDGLSFAVGVGREIDLVALFGLRLQRLDQVPLAADVHVFGRKIVLDVHAHPGFGQVAHMPHRGHDLKPSS